jgi:hypothetical protein
MKRNMDHFEKIMEDKIKELCYKAFMVNTDEAEFRFIRKEPRVLFEEWWINNKELLKNEKNNG